MSAETLIMQLLTLIVDDSDRHDLKAAIAMAEVAHDGQTRDDGTPYIVHPLRVAITAASELQVVELKTLVECVLHDAPGNIGDTEVNYCIEDISARFGIEVASDVRILSTKIGLTRAERDNYHRNAIEQASLRVKLVKLVDRLDNVRQLLTNPDTAKMARYVSETECDILPLARRTSLYVNAEMTRALADVRQLLSQR